MYNLVDRSKPLSPCNHPPTVISLYAWVDFQLIETSDFQILPLSGALRHSIFHLGSLFLQFTPEFHDGFIIQIRNTVADVLQVAFRRTLVIHV